MKEIMQNNTIAKTVSGLSVGEPTVFEHLAAFPLRGAPRAVEDYLTLEQALGSKTARVTEISESGSVPELRFVNDGNTPVLLLDGEELVGAKQNRILNLTILVAAKSEILIPVSCVEQGRWSRRSEEFTAARRTMYARGRAEKMEHVSMSMAGGGSRRANQGAVWESVMDKAACMDVSSDTGAMSDIYENRQEKLGEYTRAFVAGDGQCGALFCLGGRVAGLELFDRPAVFGALFPALVQSYALDAMEGRLQGGAASRDAVGDFLMEVSETSAQRFDALGMGEDLRFRDTRVSGAALEVEGQLVHLLAYARHSHAGDAGEQDATGESGYHSRVLPFSRRRRGH
ncbi:MAG: hypothetical protein MUP90_03495 [Gammaproteobacteria bacterium]|nr:hypothetical protein [Gammaproteobacteria bacterium]